MTTWKNYRRREEKIYKSKQASMMVKTDETNITYDQIITSIYLLISCFVYKLIIAQHLYLFKICNRAFILFIHVLHMWIYLFNLHEHGFAFHFNCFKLLVKFCWKYIFLENINEIEGNFPQIANGPPMPFSVEFLVLSFLHLDLQNQVRRDIGPFITLVPKVLP